MRMNFLNFGLHECVHKEGGGGKGGRPRQTHTHKKGGAKKGIRWGSMKTKGRANKKKRRERKDGCIWDHPHRHSLLFLIRPGGRAQSKLKAQALADLKAHHLEDALARDGLDQEDAEKAELVHAREGGQRGERGELGLGWACVCTWKKGKPPTVQAPSFLLTMAARELVTSAFSTKPNLALGAMGWTGGSVTPFCEEGRKKERGWVVVRGHDGERGVRGVLARRGVPALPFSGVLAAS